MWSNLFEKFEGCLSSSTGLSECVIPSLMGTAGPLTTSYHLHSLRYPRHHTQVQNSADATNIYKYLDSKKIHLCRDVDGDYEILGVGANSRVFKGTYTGVRPNNRAIYHHHPPTVAIKVPSNWDRPDHRECFFCELHILNKLTDVTCAPKILGPVRLGNKLGQGLVLEYIRGENLWTFIQHAPVAFGKSDWIELCLNLAEGVHQIHSAGYLHNDLKMDNILVQLQESGHAVIRIIDYGHSTGINKGLRFNYERYQMPPCYAPEVCLGERTTVASDIYTLGVALGTIMEVADLYTELGLLVKMCTDENPSKRPTTRELTRTLRHLLAFQNAAGALPLTPQNVNSIYRLQDTHSVELATGNHFHMVC